MGTSSAVRVTDEEIQKAAQIVVERGRVYLSQTKYLSVKVFAKDKEVVDLLKKVFNGNYYPQGFGIVWTIGDRRDLLSLVNMIRVFRKPFDKLDRLIDWADAQKNPLIT